MTTPEPSNPAPQDTPDAQQGDASPAQTPPTETAPVEEAPVQEVPSYPQTPTPDFDEATAAPGSVTYGHVVEDSPAADPSNPYAAGQAAYTAPTGQAYPQADYAQQNGNGQFQPGYDSNAYDRQQYATGGAYQQPGADQAAYTTGAAYQQAAYGQPQYAAPVEQKQMLVAALLAFFLGAFGVHNFYLGYTARGIVQLCLTVVSLGLLSWVSAIWAFIEFILILMRSGAYGYDAKGVPLA